MRGGEITTNITGRKFAGRTTCFPTSISPAETTTTGRYNPHIASNRPSLPCRDTDKRAGPRCSRRPRRQDDACAADRQPRGAPWAPHNRPAVLSSNRNSNSNHPPPSSHQPTNQPQAPPPARHPPSMHSPRAPPSPPSAPPTSPTAPQHMLSPAKSPSQTQTCPSLPP